MHILCTLYNYLIRLKSKFLMNPVFEELIEEDVLLPELFNYQKYRQISLIF